MNTALMLSLSLIAFAIFIPKKNKRPKLTLHKGGKDSTFEGER